LVEDQARVEPPPLDTVSEPALSETLGGAAATVTVVDWDAEPPAPVQVRVNFVVAVSADVPCDPLVGSAPLQPPEALQDVAFVDDQDNADAAPLFTVLGLAVRLMAGAALVTETVADCVALPPAPVQVRP